MANLLGLNGYDGISSLAKFCKMATIIGSPIEQFGRHLYEEGSAFGYKGILVLVPNLEKH